VTNVLRLGVLVALAMIVPTCAYALTALQGIQTVFIIPMENYNWSSIHGNANSPYINNTILPNGAHAEQYYNPPGMHPSLPNYLWMEAGTNFGITADILPSTGGQNTQNHLTAYLKAAGISWRSYSEDICGCDCPLANTNLYVPRHNPVVYFYDNTNTNNSSSTTCQSNVRPYSQFAADLQNNAVARFNWVVPNLCDDMHNSSGCGTTNKILHGDTWLANNLPLILNSSAYTNGGLVVIVWDEGAGTSDGPIGCIVMSPLAKKNYSNSIHYTHSSLLRTLQNIFNVKPYLNDAANATDLSDLFNNNAPQLAVLPAQGATSAGWTNGPFSPSAVTFTLTNLGTASMNWSVTHTAPWSTLAPTSGTLSANSATTVTASVNSAANSLGIGNYPDVISFENLANNFGNTARTNELIVTMAPLPPIFSAAAFDGSQFQVTLTGSPGSNYIVQYSSNFIDWLPIVTNPSPFTLVDTNAPQFPALFYRGLSAP
jgi:phosphatidylinositol-3-phosphatase